jgi:hypothetical protein
MPGFVPCGHILKGSVTDLHAEHVALLPDGTAP